MHAATLGARRAAVAARAQAGRGGSPRVRPLRAVAAAAGKTPTAGDTDGARTFAEAERMPVPKNFRVKIETAKYIKSSVKVEQCPRDGLTEIAVIGRSNVGKSSLINALTRSEGLAKVSKTPGKTRTINHFLINGQWYLVDLPGYGFAERQASEREVWQEFTREYFLDRKNLATVLLLVDSSVEPQQIDLDALAWMGENQIPVSLVFTKIDKKRKGSSNADNIKAFKEAVGRNWDVLPPCLETSAARNSGLGNVLQHVAGVRAFYEKEAKPTAGKKGSDARFMRMLQGN